jgi:hypothetical protein
MTFDILRWQADVLRPFADAKTIATMEQTATASHSDEEIVIDQRAIRRLTSEHLSSVRATLEMALALVTAAPPRR